MLLLTVVLYRDTDKAEGLFLYRGKRMKTVDVLLTGQVVQGADVQTSAAKLAGLAGIDQHTALQILTCGRLIRIKKGVEATTGLRYFRALQAIGVEALLRPAESTPADQVFSPEAQAWLGGGAGGRSNTANPGKRTAANKQINRTSQTGQTTRPGRTLTAPPQLGPGFQPQPVLPGTPMISPVKSRTGLLLELRTSLRAVSTRLPSFPLRRDSRRVAIALPHGPKSRRSEEWLSAPRTVAAGQGWEWLCQAWMQFTEDLGLWLLCFFLCCAMLGLLFWIPTVHIFLMVIALPVLLGALMLVAHRQYLEEPLGSLHPLSATLQRGWGLLLLGFLSLLFLLFLGSGIFMGAGFGLLSDSLLSDLQRPDSRQILLLMAGLVLVLLIALVVAGYLFAIPLVLFVQARPLHGFQLGVYGCIKNWRAMLVALGIAASGLGIFAALALGFQYLLPVIPDFVFLLFIVAFLPSGFVVGILFIYSSFRDIFAIYP